MPKERWKSEKEQLKLLIPPSWFPLTQHGLRVFNAMCSTTQTTAADINQFISHFQAYHLHYIFPISLEKGTQEARCLGEKAENRSSLAVSLMHHKCKKVTGKRSKADLREWQRRVSAVLHLFKIRPGLRGNLQVGDHDSPFWQVQSVEQRRWLWLFPHGEREWSHAAPLLLAEGNVLALTAQHFLICQR